MASTHGNVHSDTAKKEQIITEIFAKSLHIVLESRAPYVSSRNSSIEQALSSPSSSSSSPSSHRPRDKWFNLTLRECPDALKNIDFWRQSNLDPMVIDIVLVQRVVNREPAEREGIRDFQDGANTVKVIERWVVQYESSNSRDASSRSKRSCGNLHTLYKKSVLLLRSLYATVRLLPAYKLFRELTSSGHIRNYTLTHRVNSFVEPFTRKEEADMRGFSFEPVDTSPGRLCLSVLYHHTSVSGLNFEQLTPESPQFIPNYVDSPVVDPIKRLPSLPVSQSLPSYAPLSRQLSWTNGFYGGSPPSILPSPSPIFTGYRAPLSKPRSCQPPMSLPHNMEERFQVSIKNDGLIENFPPGSIFSSNANLLLPSPTRTPCVSISGSSSRVSIQDVFDFADFPCHFVDDDDDMTDPGSRPGSFDQRKQSSDPFEPGGSGPARKSQDAAVGALILMLKRAPPLQRDCSNSALISSVAYTRDSIHLRPEEPATYRSTTSSGPALTKTAADAVTELEKYSNIKAQLLRR